MTTFALKFKFWIHICIKLNSLGFIKSVVHVNVSSEWVKSIFEQIQAIYSLWSVIFPSFRPWFYIGKNTNWSISKKDIIKIFVSQWILDHWWMTLKVEAVSFLAQFFYTGHATCPLCRAQSMVAKYPAPTLGVTLIGFFHHWSILKTFFDSTMFR